MPDKFKRYAAEMRAAAKVAKSKAVRDALETAATRYDQMSHSTNANSAPAAPKQAAAPAHKAKR